MKIARIIGNPKLWERQKTLFLSSRRAPLACYEAVFQWVESLDKWGCAVCFNTSELEQEVLKALLVCCVPTALVVVGRFRDTYNVQVERALKENRLMIMELQREESDGKGFLARLRNQYVIGKVEHIVCGPINPNGSIYGLLAGHDNVTTLVGRKVLKSEEPEPKSFRWTVAEDKRLLRMFYEDMGIHAIHRATGRPYSTIYSRIKALTLDDDALKGREFEDYVVDFFDLPHHPNLALKEWRGDKSLSGIYPENNSAPDLVFEHNGRRFAVECKWRSHMTGNVEKELLSPDRHAFFCQYAAANVIPVYLLLGVGGLPSDPEQLQMTPVTAALPLPTLPWNIVTSPDDILRQTQTHATGQNHVPQYVQELRKQYPNAYMPWSVEDDRWLRKLFSAGKSIDEMMVIFQRSAGGIKSRLNLLELTR